MPPIASTLTSPVDAWIFFVLLAAWTLRALYGLSLAVPFFVRWHAAVTRMVREGINGDRRLRARGLRRRAGVYIVIFVVYVAVGVVRAVAQPGGLTSTLIGGALLLTVELIVGEMNREARDITRISTMALERRRRATDPGHHAEPPEPPAEPTGAVNV